MEEQLCPSPARYGLSLGVDLESEDCLELVQEARAARANPIICILELTELTPIEWEAWNAPLPSSWTEYMDEFLVCKYYVTSLAIIIMSLQTSANSARVLKQLLTRLQYHGMSLVMVFLRFLSYAMLSISGTGSKAILTLKVRARILCQRRQGGW